MFNRRKKKSMKLIRFYIGEYRVLSDLDINFERSKSDDLDTQKGYTLAFW